MTGVLAAPAEITEFAGSLARLLDRHGVPDRWSLDQPCSDRDAQLEEQINELGWFEVAADPEYRAFVGPAAIELGRGLAPLSLLDRLLGAALGVEVDARTALIRYAQDADAAVIFGPGGTRQVALPAGRPVGYLDAWDVRVVDLNAAGAAPADDLPDRGPWVTAMIGYLAGLTAGGYRLVADHARARIAFGKPLIKIESVANKLADARMTVDGLSLAAGETSSGTGATGLDVLAAAAPAARQALAHCHQVAGALGFTMEFPLQRYSRRVAALACWHEVIIPPLRDESALPVAERMLTD